MKILIDDGMRIQLGTGIGKYTKYLYFSLRKYIDVDLHAYESHTKNRKLGRIFYILKINSPGFIKKSAKYDCIHFAGQFFPFIRSKHTKYIATVHDLVSFIHPETLSSFTAFVSRCKIKRIMKNADMVFTVSNSVKEEMRKYFPKYIDKVVALYPGHYSEVKYYPDNHYENNRLTSLENSPFFLFVGTIEKRKNIGMIIDAFIKFKQNNEESKKYRLVLAGRDGMGAAEFKQKVCNSDYSSDVIFTGYISSDDCNRLYSNAAAYIFPTIYEGFGSTQLECMECQTPLILSDIPTNREISGEYGMFFSLNSIDELVEQMRVVASTELNKEKQLDIAKKKLEKFSWDNLIIDYLKQYRSLVGE